MGQHLLEKIFVSLISFLPNAKGDDVAPRFQRFDLCRCQALILADSFS